jgi:hypothetical protein
MNLEKTYRELMKEQMTLKDSTPEQLNELRFLRGASALMLSSKAKRHGDKVVQNANQGKTHLRRVRKKDPIEDQLEEITNALEEMFECLIESRNQLGSVTGVALTSVLISERSTKELTKILNKRR